MEPPTSDQVNPDEPLTEPTPASPDQPDTEPTPGAGAAPPLQYGGFWRRVAAILLDGLIVSISYLPATIALLIDPLSWAWVLLLVVSGLAGVVYFPVCWARWGATPGMSLMGLYVVRRTTLARISGWRAVGRYFAQVLAALPLGLGYLWVVFNGERRGWHDMLAGTVVLRVASLRERGDVPRRRWAIGAVLGGTVSLLAYVVVFTAVAIAIATGGIRDASGAITQRQAIAVFSVRTGDCFDADTSNGLSTVVAVPCAEAHTFEAFGRRSITESTYPAETDLRQEAEQTCVPAFQGYVGTAIDSSSFAATYIAPDAVAWEQGNRALICILYDRAQAPLTGSVRGSAR